MLVVVGVADDVKAYAAQEGPLFLEGAPIRGVPIAAQRHGPAEVATSVQLLHLHPDALAA